MGFCKIFVDGKTVIETNRTESAELKQLILKKGKHTIEVEYQVNWHAGFFRAKIGTVNPAYTDINVARSAAKTIAGSNAVTLKLNEYSPADAVTGITVMPIPNNTMPKILDLESYEPTVWDVQGAEARM